MDDEVGDILPTFVLPSTVKAIQGALNGDFTAVRLALQNCQDAGKFKENTPDWLAWQSLKGRILDYLAETPSWLTTKDQVDRGQLLQRELVGWHDRVKQMGCDAGPAPLLPAESTLPTMFGGVSVGLLAAIALFLWFGGGTGRR